LREAQRAQRVEAMRDSNGSLTVLSWNLMFWALLQHMALSLWQGAQGTPRNPRVNHHFPISNKFPSNTHSHPSWTIIWEIFGKLPTSHDLKLHFPWRRLRTSLGAQSLCLRCLTCLTHCRFDGGKRVN
jgi:predicted secreted hydrolase